jgi:hypothetical protein
MMDCSTIWIDRWKAEHAKALSVAAQTSPALLEALRTMVNHQMATRASVRDLRFELASLLSGDA